MENGTLTITGKTADERRAEEGSYLVQEIRRGTFSRAVTLPNGLEPDKASATFEHGVLTLRIPKAEQVKPHQIRISPVTEATADRGGRGSGRGLEGLTGRRRGPVRVTHPPGRSLAIRDDRST